MKKNLNGRSVTCTVSASISNKPVSKKKKKPAGSKKTVRGKANPPKYSELEVSKHGSRLPTKAMKSTVKRDSHGRVMAGSGSNGGGRPRGTFRPSLSKTRTDELRRAILEFELEALGKKRCKRKEDYANWLRYQIKKSFDDSTIANTLLKMRFPLLKSVDQTINPADEIDDDEAQDIRREMQRRCGTEFIDEGDNDATQKENSCD